MPLPVHGLLARDPTPLAQLFLVEHRGVLTLIDTGTPGTAPRVLRAIARLGRRPDDVRQIVVTHAHGDHAGDARALHEATGATLVVGAGDAGTLAGEAPYPGPRGVSRLLYGRLARYPRVRADRVVDGREELDGGLVAVPTPGHTPGHLSVLAPDLEALFAADAVFHVGPLAVSWRPLTADPERARDSVRLLAAERAEQAFFGHGRPIRRGAAERLRHLSGRR